jgi:hypothetical protein
LATEATNDLDRARDRPAPKSLDSGTAFDPDGVENPAVETTTSKKLKHKKREDAAARKTSSDRLIKSREFDRYVQRLGLVGDRDHRYLLTLQVVGSRLKATSNDVDPKGRGRVAALGVTMGSFVPPGLTL